MRGSDRCDEIVKLIDETLGGSQAARPAAAAVPDAGGPTAQRRPAGWRAPFTRTTSTKSGAAGEEERRRLMAAVEAFLVEVA